MKRMNLAERLKTFTDPSACWNWPGKTTNPYPLTRVVDNNGRSRSVLAGREAYQILVAPIPPELTVDHLCRNTRCLNPAHMEIVTRGENARRGQLANSAYRRKTHCPNGHPYKGDNLYTATDGSRRCKTCTFARTLQHRKEGRYHKSRITPTLARRRSVTSSKYDSRAPSGSGTETPARTAMKAAKSATQIRIG